MPYGSVYLQPGVNVEMTPTLLTASLSSSSLVRFRDGLVQKYGGWTSFLGTTAGGIPRDLHAWEDLNGTAHLGVASVSTTQLAIITNNALVDITPQTLTSNLPPAFTTQSGGARITWNDAAINNFDICAVLFNTPIAIGGVVLSGLYPEVEASGTAIVITTDFSTATNTTGGAVPQFTTISGNYSFSVLLDQYGVSSGDTAVFNLPSTGGGLTISGAYVVEVTDSNNFLARTLTSATISTTFAMNNGSANIVYYVAQPFGLAQDYQRITASDWTQDNWGEILLACPSGGPIFEYNPSDGRFMQAASVAGTLTSSPTIPPPVNGGIFVSTQQQILVAWASSIQNRIGFQQEALLVAWSDSGDYTDFTATTTNQAGNYVIPSGSRIVGGMATPNQNLIWTDIDCWAMNYIGPPLVYAFNKIGAGAGLISSHAAQELLGNVYWMGPSNFYSVTGAGLSVMYCPVWDFVFQNINTSFLQNVRAMPNTPFNEAGWLFPSTNSTTGECDCYVKMNILEPGNPWDCGPSNAMQRSAWTDQSVFGNPIAADSSGNIWQHEIGNNNGSTAMLPSLTTGYFMIADGEDYCFVDQIIPDFIWGDYGQSQNASLQLTFNVVNFPGDTPNAYGPYTVTQATEYIMGVRFRGRQMSITVAGSDLNSFWRLGRIRYRWAPSGRR